MIGTAHAIKIDITINRRGSRAAQWPSAVSQPQKRLPSQAQSRLSKCPAVCAAGWVWCLSRTAASQPHANVSIISAAKAEAGSEYTAELAAESAAGV